MAGRVYIVGVLENVIVMSPTTTTTTTTPFAERQNTAMVLLGSRWVFGQDHHFVARGFFERGVPGATARMQACRNASLG